MLADPTDREHELLGAFPYQPNEAVLHTDTRLLPRRRRAWASWNYHLLGAPTGRPTVTYHMNRLQSLDSRPRVLRHAEPDRGDRPGEDDPHDPVRAPRLHARPEPRRRRRHEEISGPQPHALLRRLLGLGLPRGRRRERDPRRRAAGSAPHDPQRGVRRHGPPPPLRRPPARAAPPRRDGLRRPRRAAAAARRAAARAPPRPRPLPPRATTSAIPRRRSPTRCARSWRSARAPRRTARSACSRTCARSGTASTRSASTTASTATSTCAPSSPR